MRGRVRRTGTGRGTGMGLLYTSRSDRSPLPRKLLRQMLGHHEAPLIATACGGEGWGELPKIVCFLGEIGSVHRTGVLFRLQIVCLGLHGPEDARPFYGMEWQIGESLDSPTPESDCSGGVIHCARCRRCRGYGMVVNQNRGLVPTARRCCRCAAGSIGSSALSLLQLEPLRLQRLDVA